MNKKDLVKAIAEKLGTTQKDAEASLNGIVAVITDSLVDGQDVKVPGLGTFSVVDVEERRGIIQMGDRKGEEYVTPAHRAPKFKFSKTVKDIVK